MQATDITPAIVRGLCPAPFLDVGAFPDKGGYIAGRVCSNLYKGITCCLPCPTTDWIYTSSFSLWYKIAQGFSTAGLVICLFLIISWLVLPNERTKSHYLGFCLVIGIGLECLAFVIPLGVSHNPCYNEITPNDMISNLTCAFSGASLVLGGLLINVWIAIRSLSMHLQICWDVVPGTNFFFFAMTLGWGFPLVVFALSMWLAGVSYRFGDTCHLNATHSLGVFWIPMLVVAGAAAILQLGTLLYCAKVYLRNVWGKENNEPKQSGSRISSSLPSYQGSGSRTRQARIVYQRVKRILWLQWRSVTIVISLVADIVFFSIVWIELDSAMSNINKGKTESILAFLTCILVNPTVEQRAVCFPLGQKVVVNEKVCIALLMMLSLTGIQTGLLLSRASLFPSWLQFFRSQFDKRNKEFVSLDAKRMSMGGMVNSNMNYTRGDCTPIQMNPVSSQRTEPRDIESGTSKLEDKERRTSSYRMNSSGSTLTNNHNSKSITLNTKFASIVSSSSAANTIISPTADDQTPLSSSPQQYRHSISTANMYDLEVPASNRQISPGSSSIQNVRPGLAYTHSLPAPLLPSATHHRPAAPSAQIQYRHYHSSPPPRPQFMTPHLSSEPTWEYVEQSRPVTANAAFMPISTYSPIYNNSNEPLHFVRNQT